jgi:hypothetical protein
VHLHDLWHTFPMATAVSSSKVPRVRKRTPMVGADLQPAIGSAVKRVLKAGGSDFRFPALSGAEAAALMQAAGIVNQDGKLASKYR